MCEPTSWSDKFAQEPGHKAWSWICSGGLEFFNGWTEWSGKLFLVSRGRQEGFVKSFKEVIPVMEMFFAVIFIFLEESDIDEIIDDFAEVLASMNAPLVEEESSHWAVFVEGELPDAVEEVLTCDMDVGFITFIVLAQGAGLSECEGITHEIVGFPLVAVVHAHKIPDLGIKFWISHGAVDR